MTGSGLLYFFAIEFAKKKKKKNNMKIAKFKAIFFGYGFSQCADR